jgi:hypothetical protein
MSRVLSVVAVINVALLVGCGGAEVGSPPAAAPSTTTPTPTERTPPSPEPATPRTVVVDCSTLYEITMPDTGLSDFTAVWAAKEDYCEGDTIMPVTALEQSAYTASKYDDSDIGTLYGICAANNPADVYASPGFAASPDQIPEITAALMLCP